MRQLPGDHRPTGPQLCALLAEAGQCHQQLQHQPHLGHGSTRPARLSLGNPLAQPPGPWLLQPPPSSHLLLGALTPDGGEGAPGRALVPTSPPNKSQSLARPCRWFFGAGWHGACPRPLWTSAFLAVKWVFPVVSGGRCGRVSEACCGRASDLHCPPPTKPGQTHQPPGESLELYSGGAVGLADFTAGELLTDPRRLRLSAPALASSAVSLPALLSDLPALGLGRVGGD